MRILSTSMRHISSTERKSLHGRSISRMYLEKAIQHVHTHDKFKVDKAWHCRKSSSQTQYINEIRELRGTRSDMREREMLLSSSEVNMTHETKNITFHVIHVKVSSKSWCSQELYRWMLQPRVHIVVVREICARIRLSWRDVESMAEYDQRQSIVSKCDTQTLELV